MTGRAGEKSTSSQSLCQTKGAAAVNVEQLSKFIHGDWLFGKSHHLKDRETSIQALDERQL